MEDLRCYTAIFRFFTLVKIQLAMNRHMLEQEGLAYPHKKTPHYDL